MSMLRTTSSPRILLMQVAVQDDTLEERHAFPRHTGYASSRMGKKLGVHWHHGLKHSFWTAVKSILCL